MPRAKLGLPYGQGLDRETGVMVYQAPSMEHLKNVVLFEGKAQVRRGLGSSGGLVFPDSTPATHVLAIQDVRAHQVAVAIGYDEVSRLVGAFVLDTEGTPVSYLGDWFTLAEDATHDPPIVISVDTRGMAFFAHDEPHVTRRAQTYRYDPAGLDLWTGLSTETWTNFDEETDEAEPVKFRGVAEHLKYLVGWGYGGPEDQNRPEMLRVSLPGNPEAFDPDSYMNMGQRFDPILRAESLDNALICFKNGEYSAMVGGNPREFAERPIDHKFGVESSRLMAEVNGVIFFWSAEGPRVTTGGVSQDLSIPLDLTGLSPEDLVEKGLTDTGFAVYAPTQKLILFVFGKRVYCLSIRQQPYKWSYWEFGVEPFSGGEITRLPDSKQVAPLGHPDVSAYTPFSDVGSTFFIVEWDNVNAAGDEIVEVWVKKEADTWDDGGLSAAARVQIGASPQTLRIERVVEGVDLELSTTYDVALRYRRGTLYTEGYTGTPDSWPAVSQGQATTVAISAPRMVFAEWTRTGTSTESVGLFADAEEAEDVRFYRDDGGGEVLVATVTPAELPVVGLVAQFSDDTITGETAYTYFARHFDGAAESADSNHIETWAGPPPPATSDALTLESGKYHAVATYEGNVYPKGPAGFPATVALEAHQKNITDADPGFTLGGTGEEIEVDQTDGTVDPSGGMFSQDVVIVDVSPGGNGDDFEIKLRTKLKSWGVLDFSDFSEVIEITVLP